MEPVNQGSGKGVGERIARQRRALGLSQAVFAKRVGVSLSSQKRYENGERTPDADYLAALRGLGVDVDFVMTGNTGSDLESDRVINGLIELITKIGTRIGSTPAAIARAWTEPMENPRIFRDGGSVSEALVDSFFEGADLDIDPALLEAVLEGISDAEAQLGRVLGPNAKARVASVLYRSFKGSGRVDNAMILDTVRLAG